MIFNSNDLEVAPPHTTGVSEIWEHGNLLPSQKFDVSSLNQERIMPSKICQLCLSEIPNEAIVCRYCGHHQINLEKEYQRVAFKKLLTADRNIGDELPSKFVRRYSLGYYKAAYALVSVILGVIIMLLIGLNFWWFYFFVAPVMYTLGMWLYVYREKKYYRIRRDSDVQHYARKLKEIYEPADLLTFMDDDISDRLRSLEKTSNSIWRTIWILGIIIILALTNPTTQDFSNTSYGKNGGFYRLNLVICSIYTTNTNQSYFGIVGNLFKM
jgi:ribosomal protein L40E